MRVLIVGAGQVGTAVSESLHADHDVTVVDVDAERLNALSYRYDILTVAGDGTSRAVLEQAGVRDSDLIIASTDRDAVNVVVALQARALSRGTLVARTQSVEYLGAWRAGQFDVDHMVSSEVETAEAVAILEQTNSGLLGAVLVQSVGLDSRDFDTRGGPRKGSGPHDVASIQPVQTLSFLERHEG